MARCCRRSPDGEESWVVSRRWLWGVAGAVALLWLARGARAETELEYEQGPYFKRQAPPAESAASPASPRAAVPPRKASAPRARATAPRRAAPQGYAADSARTAMPSSPEEREARNFLRAAAAGARFEAEVGRLAAARAESPLVRLYAAELHEDQSAAHAELLRLLAARAMAPPMVEGSHRRALNRLAKLSGPRFDREFVELVGRDRQRREVRQYEKAVLAVTDPVIKAWIDRQLHSLRRQEAQAATLVPSHGRRAQQPVVRRVAQDGSADGNRPDPR